MTNFHLKTERVGLRKFLSSDLDRLAEMHSDPRVMQHFPKCLDRNECQAMMQRINHSIDQHGLGFWAAEHLSSGQLIGLVGLSHVRFVAEFTPAVEIGWRLARPFWGQGLATEAARACLRFGFEQASLTKIVAFTSPLNGRSLRVMHNIGMSKWSEFDHPGIPGGHRLRRHVLYGIRRPEADRVAS